MLQQSLSSLSRTAFTLHSSCPFVPNQPEPAHCSINASTFKTVIIRYFIASSFSSAKEEDLSVIFNSYIRIHILSSIGFLCHRPQVSQPTSHVLRALHILRTTPQKITIIYNFPNLPPTPRLPQQPHTRGASFYSAFANTVHFTLGTNLTGRPYFCRVNYAF